MLTLLSKIHHRAPLVHCITNTVTQNDCANILLALGASPVMAEDSREVQEMVRKSQSLVLNIGTITPASQQAMEIALAEARLQKRPVVFDPVGAGATNLRTSIAKELLSQGGIHLVRGNISEMMALIGREGVTKGVDASPIDAESPEAMIANAKEVAAAVAQMYHVAVAISGPVDLIGDGRDYLLVRNGVPLMSKVTGTGCMLTALCGGFLAVTSDVLQAASLATATICVAGELALEHLQPFEGNAAFRNHLIDAIYHLDDTMLQSKMNLEGL